LSVAFSSTTNKFVLESDSSILEMLVIGAGSSGLAFAIKLAQGWKDAKRKKPNMIDLYITIG
jgi:hypothetical protein